MLSILRLKRCKHVYSILYFKGYIRKSVYESIWIPNTFGGVQLNRKPIWRICRRRQRRLRRGRRKRIEQKRKKVINIFRENWKSSYYPPDNKRWRIIKTLQEENSLWWIDRLKSTLKELLYQTAIFYNNGREKGRGERKRENVKQLYKIARKKRKYFLAGILSCQSRHFSTKF